VEQFDMTQIESIRVDLEKHWKSWPQKSTAQQQDAANRQFWGHEWKKHGTCSGLNQLQYFKKALELFEFNIQDRRICTTATPANKCNICWKNPTGTVTRTDRDTLFLTTPCQCQTGLETDQLAQSTLIPEPRQVCEVYGGRVLEPPKEAQFHVYKVLAPDLPPIAQQAGVVCIFNCDLDKCESFAKNRKERKEAANLLLQAKVEDPAAKKEEEAKKPKSYADIAKGNKERRAKDLEGECGGVECTAPGDWASEEYQAKHYNMTTSTVGAEDNATEDEETMQRYPPVVNFEEGTGHFSEEAGGF